MAPEVMCRKNHSYAVDYFALGVLGYEFMLGRRPYNGKNRKEIRDQIMSKQAAVRIDELPYKWSPDAADLINKLLIRNPDFRLGNGGINEIKEHRWFRDIDWLKMQKKKLVAPFIPQVNVGLFRALNRIMKITGNRYLKICLLYTSPSPRDKRQSRMPSSA